MLNRIGALFGLSGSPVSGSESLDDTLISDLGKAGSAVYETVYSRVGPEFQKRRESANDAVGRYTSPLRSFYREVREEVGGLLGEVKSEVAAFQENELKETKEAVRREWTEFRAAVATDDSAFGQTASGTADWFDAIVNDWFGTPKPGKGGPWRPRAAWRSMKRATGLLFEGAVEQDASDDAGSDDARVLLRRAERMVNHYLAVALWALVVSGAGVLFWAPLKLAGALLICYVAYPAFKGGVLDIFIERRITIRVLDSIAVVGLLASGLIFICALNTLVFHACAKLLLKTEGRSRRMIADLFGLQPETVRLLVEDVEVDVPFELLSADDLVVVCAGQTVPADGVVQSGTASIDQRVLTGEPQLVDRTVGDAVFAATVLRDGRIVVAVQRTGSETAAAQIRELLANRTGFRAAIQARWRDIADRTVPLTGLVSALAWFFSGRLSALAVLNSNYVAVMKAASPLGMLNYLQRAIQNGVLVKDGRTLEAGCTIDTVVFDKTGTLTLAQPEVNRAYPFGSFTETEVIGYAAAVEADQRHPVALAILAEAQIRNLSLPHAEDVLYEAGYGVRATVGGRLVRAGSARFMDMEHIDIPPFATEALNQAQLQGSSIIYVAIGNLAAGVIELKPRLRDEAREVISKLKRMGMELFIVSGDSAAPTEALAAEVGIERYFAEVAPQEKARLLKDLQMEGRRVCFVGDGITDAIVLKSAAVSVSLRGASSLAANSAQVVLMSESLRQLSAFFEMARGYRSSLRTLLMTTFIPGVASLGGIFLFGTGNTVALGLFNMSMIAGLVNAAWPALHNLESGLRASPLHETPEPAPASGSVSS